MKLSIPIQKFLRRNLIKKNLKRKDFAQKINIPYPTITRLINASRNNPEFMTIVALANFFHCSIDEVIGRKQYVSDNSQRQFLQLSVQEIQINLISFIRNKLILEKITAYQLAKKLKLGETVIFDFIKDNSRIHILSSPVIVKLANYYCIALDKMVKRTIISNSL